jgi:hypothetical protein
VKSGALVEASIVNRQHAPKRVKFVLPATAWAKMVWISQTLAMDLCSMSTHPTHRHFSAQQPWLP